MASCFKGDMAATPADMRQGLSEADAARKEGSTTKKLFALTYNMLDSTSLDRASIDCPHTNCQWTPYDGLMNYTER